MNLACPPSVHTAPVYWGSPKDGPPGGGRRPCASRCERPLSSSPDGADTFCWAGPGRDPRCRSATGSTTARPPAAGPAVDGQSRAIAITGAPVGGQPACSGASLRGPTLRRARWWARHWRHDLMCALRHRAPRLDGHTVAAKLHAALPDCRIPSVTTFGRPGLTQTLTATLSAHNHAPFGSRPERASPSGRPPPWPSASARLLERPEWHSSVG